MSTHTQATMTTVRSSVVVEAPIERAFEVFTKDFDRFKPREHNMLPVDIAESVFEPHVGGHLYDRGVDGSECRWARVLVYEPPHRVVFTWDISPRWQIETDRDRSSEVEVRFIRRDRATHPRCARAPLPRPPRRGLGRPARGRRRKRWLAVVPAAVRRAVALREWQQGQRERRAKRRKVMDTRFRRALAATLRSADPRAARRIPAAA